MRLCSEFKTQAIISKYCDFANMKRFFRKEKQWNEDFTESWVRGSLGDNGETESLIKNSFAQQQDKVNLLRSNHPLGL